MVGDSDALNIRISCNASPYCWQRYNELLVYTLSLGDKEFIHQHAIDTYAAQHSGSGLRPIQICFALIGLYLYLERGYSGKEVQQAHRKLAERTKDWTMLMHARPIPSMTVVDILRSTPGESRNDRIRQWADAVWDEWAPEHTRIASWCEQFLYV